jgi:D-tyrosyl-tRNA(Tyr) deacylase
MRAVVQRVTSGAVAVEGETIGSIGRGLVVLVGVGHGDGARQAEQLASKIVNLRIFADAEGKFNRSASEVGAEVLVVSQFTLYADTRKGRRPSFVEAAPPEQAEPLVEHVARTIEGAGLRVATGRFGASMLVSINNDGPVTLILEVT